MTNQSDSGFGEGIHMMFSDVNITLYYAIFALLHATVVPAEVP